MSIGILRAGLLALSAVALTIGLGSCGKVAEGGGGALFDSNTNWLSRCLDDNECNGSLRCYCGMCTKPCGQDNECNLLGGAQCAQSGEDVCGEQASAGGLCVLQCTGSNDCGDGFNCSAGQCVPKPCVTLGALSWDDVFQFINADLARSDAADRPFQRYIALGNSSGDGSQNGRCGVSTEIKRDALIKLMNALSIQAPTQRVVGVDAGQRLFRIDLRDFSWDRRITVGGAYTDEWEALVAKDPYALPFTGADADDAVDDTGTSVPVMLADSFIALTTLPDVYYGLLGIPEQLDQYLVDEFGIDPAAPVVEAAFTDGRPFLAKYWPMQTRSGFVWEVADFGQEPDFLFQNPLAEPVGQRELIFTLPNGLTAFAFMDSDGRRLDSWSVTYDSAEPDNVARAPRSNWRRHPRQVVVRDEMNDYVAAHADQYATEDLSKINRLFIGPTRLESLLERDYSTFQAAALLNVSVTDDDPEPITTSYAEYERPVTLEVAAAELMVTPAELRDNLNLLNPALLALDGGTVSRELFTALYQDSACILNVVLENQPADCP